MSKETYKIKNKATGFVFHLTKEDCDRLVTEEPHNFVVVDDDYVSPLATPQAKTSTYKKVVEDGGDGNKPKTYEEMTVAELKDILEERKIEFAKSAKKADLIELVEADDKAKAEATDEDGGDGKDEE